MNYYNAYQLCEDPEATYVAQQELLAEEEEEEEETEEDP